MNHIVVSDKNYRLYADTLAECKEFARDWAIKQAVPQDSERALFRRDQGAPGRRGCSAAGTDGSG